MRTSSARWMAAALAAALSVTASSGAMAQAARAMTPIPDDKDKVVGSIAIDYNSRSERSQSAVDIYSVQDPAVADLLIMKGDIQRIPGQRLSCSVRLDVVNRQNPSQVARDAAILRGDTPIDSGVRYNPKDDRLRLDVIG